MRSDMGSAVADQTRTTTRSCRTQKRAVHAYSPGVAAVPAAAAAAVTAALLAAAAAATVIRQFTD